MKKTSISKYFKHILFVPFIGVVLALCSGMSFAEAEEAEAPLDSNAQISTLHTSIWAGPESSVLAKLLHQIATNLRYDKQVVITYNLFKGDRDAHYLVDIYQELMDAFLLSKLPDAAILRLDQAISLSKEMKLFEIPPSMIPSKKLNQSMLDVVKKGDKYIGIPLYDGNQLLMYYNKSIIETPPATWGEVIKLEQQLSRSGINAGVWPMSSAQWFCGIVGCTSTDDIDTITTKLNGYHDLVNQLPAVTQCEKKCDSDICRYECAQESFYKERSAMMINGDWAISEATNELGNKIGISTLPATVSGEKLSQHRYPTVLVFFGDPMSKRRIPITKAVIKAFYNKLNQKGMYYIAGKMPVHKKVHETVSKSIDKANTLIDFNLQMLKSSTLTGYQDWTPFDKPVDEILREFIIDKYMTINEAAESIADQVRN